MARIAPVTRNVAPKSGDTPMGEFLPKALSIVGGVVGGIYGGPSGAMGGAGAGNQIGSTIGGFSKGKDVAGYSKTMEGVDSESDSGAISRRLAASREDRLAALNKAQQSLASMPDDVRQEYAPIIVQATMAEEKRRASGMRSA